MEELSGNSTNNSSEVIVFFSTTTGSNFQIQVNSELTVDNLKKILSKKLKVIKERICLLLKYPER